jgi:hypothetical protein
MRSLVMHNIAEMGLLHSVHFPAAIKNNGNFVRAAVMAATTINKSFSLPSTASEMF